MKKILMMVVAICFINLTFAQKNDDSKKSKYEFLIEKAHLYGQYAIKNPILNDSVDNNGNKFQKKQHLKTNVSIENNLNQTISADSEGVFNLKKSENELEFYVLNFEFVSNCYIETTLELKTPDMVQVFVNGEKMKDKTTTEDSLSKAEKLNVALKLEPKSYQITLKLLATKGEKSEFATFSAKILTDSTNYQAISALESGKKPIVFEEILEGTSLYNMSISPSGKYILNKYLTTHKGGKTTTYYAELLDNESGKIVTRFPKTSYTWMPSTDQLYFTEKLDGKKMLKMLNPANFEETVICKNIPEGSFQWAANEKFLIFTINNKSNDKKEDFTRFVEPHDRMENWRDRSFIYHFDLESEILQQLTFGYKSTYLNDISQDGEYILYSCSRTKMEERPFSENSIFRLHLETMKLDTIFFNQKFVSSAQFSPDGKNLLISGTPESFNSIGKNCGKHKIPNNYDGQLFIYNLETKEVNPITKNFNPSINSAYWAIDNNIYLKVVDKDCENLYVYSVSNQKFEKMPLQVEVMMGYDKALRSNAAVYWGQSVSQPTVGFAFDFSTKESKNIADPSAERMAEIALGECKDWNFETKDGTEIIGRYYLPYNFDASKKYPMIVYYYGGTTPVQRYFGTNWNFHYWASQGYVVYVLQPSGAIGFGQEFSSRHVNAWGKYTADEIIQGTKLFCKEHSFVDSEKIGCIGASYGGFMTMYLQTVTDIFAAAISHAGISSLSSYWGEGYWGYGYSGAASAESYPWNNWDLYTENSPLFNADKVKTPLLLLHGEVDTNVPIGESWQMYTALKILGKPVEFVRVAGENHVIAAYDKKIGWTKSIVAWFAKYLQDNDAWWSALYPEKKL